MFKHCSVLLAACLATTLAGTAAKAESNTGTIVISDEQPQPFGLRCNANRLISAAWCHGSFCDNMIYQCSYPPTIPGKGALSMVGDPYIANASDASRNYGWTSDEQGYTSQNATCKRYHALVGMYSTGSYSDNIRSVCAAVAYPANTTTIYVHAPAWNSGISDETPAFAPPTLQAAFISGAACTGSFCDNMFFGWTEAW